MNEATYVDEPLRNWLSHLIYVRARVARLLWTVWAWGNGRVSAGMTHFGRGGDRNGLNHLGIIRKPCSKGNRLRGNSKLFLVCRIWGE